jgi:hypothetical protein
LRGNHRTGVPKHPTADEREEHPLGDGRALGDVRAGDLIDGERVERVTTEPYAGGYTYDLLPARGTGRYVASGVFVGSPLNAR